MSNGGFMAYRLACELSNRIAAIAPVASSMSMTNCIPIRPVPIIQFHSSSDSNVPYLGGVGNGFSNHYNSPIDSVLNVWSNNNTCSIINDTVINNSQYIFTKWSNCDCSTEIHYYRTQDGGHSWPGGIQTPTGDPVSTYINATDLMWTFFQQHSLNCNPLSVSGDFIEENNISIYPNPTKGTLIINIKNNYKSLEISIYTAMGQKVFNSQNQEVIKMDEFATGTYFAFINIDGNTTIEQIVKE